LKRHEAVEAFIAATKADTRHGGDKACFVPSKDFINLPPANSFNEIESYFATTLHELVIGQATNRALIVICRDGSAHEPTQPRIGRGTQCSISLWSSSKVK
jgi:antirestriction protein ArdC